MPPEDGRDAPKPSLLDRLIGFAEEGDSIAASARRTRGGRARRIAQLVGAGKREVSARDWFIASVKEDLRCLLNTKRALTRIDPRDPLRQSLLAYGLADLSDRTPAELRTGRFLQEEVRTAVETFEPRLTGVVVEIEPVRDNEHELRLRLSANLILDSGTQRISFDTVMHLGNREIVIKGGTDGGEVGGLLPS